jgi:hypothetical protein
MNFFGMIFSCFKMFYIDVLLISEVLMNEHFISRDWGGIFKLGLSLQVVNLFSISCYKDLCCCMQPQNHRVSKWISGQQGPPVCEVLYFWLQFMKCECSELCGRQIWCK